ncbi:Ataxin-7-like protein 1 [Pteropus alecto]|uniref:Ataxin-7-like protein 1 n=1 Tax=Pteropus alecto TaxID=9402 RepID=L5K1Y4_PTEAL|nr:Ataxin-7-like protein 1 [Pteropus alecto]
MWLQPSINILDATIKALSTVSLIPAVIPSSSHKPSKPEPENPQKSKPCPPACSDKPPSNKKRKYSPGLLVFLLILLADIPLFAILRASQKNYFECQFSFELLSGGPSHGLPVYNSSNGWSPLSTKLEPSGRTWPPIRPADIWRHMSLTGSSSDSCPFLVLSFVGDLSLASHDAVSSMPLSFDKSEEKKKHKNLSSSSKACKITKMPGINNVHKKNLPSLLALCPAPPLGRLGKITA